MGINAVMYVEGTGGQVTEELPIMLNGDGKFLASLVFDWFTDPARLKKLGLSRTTAESLSALETDYEEIHSEADIPWRESRATLDALIAFRERLPYMKEVHSAITKTDPNASFHQWYYDDLVVGWWEQKNDLDDAIEACRWATDHNRRVWLLIS